MTTRFCLLSLNMFCLCLFAQESVFVKGKEQGNGYTRPWNGSLYVVAPAHVVDQGTGSVEIINAERQVSKGKVIEMYDGDVAIVQLEGRSAEAWNVSPLLEKAMENTSTGHLEYRDEFGGTSLIHVNIVYRDNQIFTVTPTTSDGTFFKGLSGSLFYLVFNGTKILAGMLLNIDDTRTGNIIQIDDVDRITSSFFAPGKTMIRANVSIFEKGKVSSKIQSQVLQGLSESMDIKVSSDDRIAVEILRNRTQVGRGTVDQLLTGKSMNAYDRFIIGFVTSDMERNESNLYVIRTSMETFLYDKNDVQVINVIGKGINHSQGIAEDQSLRSLTKNLIKQLK